MSRQIKFRAWDAVNNQMWHGFELVDTQFRYPPQVTEPPLKTLDFMQYTGLKDKNGVEIYEGDILQIYTRGYSGHLNRQRVATIHWSEMRSHIGWNMGNGSPELREVIGNIYENPELIKEVK